MNTLKATISKEEADAILSNSSRKTKETYSNISEISSSE